MCELSFARNIVSIKNGVNITLPYAVLDAYEANNVIVVLVDPDDYIGKEKRYKNLVAYNFLGEEIWEADFPQNYKPDYYWTISNRNPLIVNSYSSHECVIELSTGKILSTSFYK